MNQFDFLLLILLYAWPILLWPERKKIWLLFHFTDNSTHLGQTSSDSLSGLSYELFYSTGLTTFIDQLSAEVSLATMPPWPKTTIDSFFTTSSKRTCRQNETTADGGGAGANKNFIFRPPPFTSLRHRCTTHCVIQGKWSYPIFCGLPVDRAVQQLRLRLLLIFVFLGSFLFL